MKKILSILLSAVLLLTAVLALTACQAKEPVEQEAQAAEETGIVGIWKNDTDIPGVEFVYTFRSDGTGQYDAGGTVMPFTYTTDGDQLSILYDGDTVSFDTTYEFKDGKLNVKDSSDEDTWYERTGSAADADAVPSAQSDVPALKDNKEEAGFQIQVAFQQWIGEAYGDSIMDANVYVEMIYNTEEEQAVDALKDYNLAPDEVAFEVRYELLPAEGADINLLTAATGMYDEESGWITEKYNVGILRPDSSSPSGYVVTDVGTGW